MISVGVDKILAPHKGDWAKIALVAIVVIGALAETFGYHGFREFWTLKKG